MSDNTAPMLSTVKANYAGENDVVTFSSVADDFISNVSISSNNATNSNIASSDGNNEITLTITALYNITQPTVTFQTGGVDITGNVTVSGSGTNYTASFTADILDNFGDVTFSITNYEYNSTAGAEITNTTDGSKVQLIGKKLVQTTRVSVANTQLGGDFIGIDNNYENLGEGVAINGDGTIVAMCSAGNDEVNSSEGKIDVFKYSYTDATWNTMGSSIRPIHFGIPNSNPFGNYRSTISLDENGTTMAISAGQYDLAYIVIVKYDGSDWTQQGSTITLSKTTSESICLKLNSFGHHLIVGMQSTNSVYVYRYNGSNWLQLGNTITSENIYSELQFGYSVTINGIGNRILVGCAPASYNLDYSNVIYEYRSGQWVEIHAFNLSHNGGSGTGWGCSVDMSFDGNTISIGGAYSPDSWPNYSIISESDHPQLGKPNYVSGVIILQYDGTTWNQLGNTIISTNNSNWGFGNTHSLSKDGTVILIGEPSAQDENGNGQVGRVYVYQYDGSSTWNQVGSTYIGKGHIEGGSVTFGKYLGLSLDGTTMMVGAGGYDITGSSNKDQGLVQVFETGCGNKTILDKIDNIIPQCNSLSLSSNATYSQYAGAGDTITLSMVTNTSINSPTVSFTIGGNDILGNVTVTGSETTWTASFVVDSADSLGVVGFAVQVTALDNTEGLLTNTTTDNTGVTIVGSVIISGVVPTTVTTTSNLQIGNSIVGERGGDYSGGNDCLSLNKDGSVVAIGSLLNNDNGNGVGHVRVWKRDTNAAIGWIQIGQDIVGEGTGDDRSAICSINDDGTIVAIGAYWNDAGAINGGHVRVWQYNGTDTWNQIGQSIVGTSTHDNFGKLVKINSDGTIVAFLAPTNGSDNVRVYQYNGTDTWNQIGQNIVNANLDVDSISLSSDGNRVAISDDLDDTNGSNTGCTRVYQYNGTDTWNQIGQDIVGTNDNDYEGWHISLSGNGNRIGVKSRRVNENTGRDRIWEYNGSDTWNQIGQDIVGENTGDGGGGAMELNYDGSVFATGFTANDGNHSNAGFVRVYQYNGTDTWNKIGTDYDGLAEDDYSGRSVSISNDGHIIAIGADFNDDNGDRSGHVRIYETGLSGNVMGDADVLTIPPTITSLTISSNNTQYPQQYAGENDVVTLNIVADVSMNQPTVSFTSGGAAVAGAVTYTGSDTSWTAQYTVNSADTIGIVGFTVVPQSIVLLGNTNGSQVISTTDSSEITIVGSVIISGVVPTTVTTTSNLQIGNSIAGERGGDYSGGNDSLSLNKDGSVVAIGAVYSPDNGNSSGHVRVWKRDTNAAIGWIKIGQDIVGSGLRSGACSINDDGNIVAIGTYWNSDAGGFAGHVRIWQYNGTDTWNQIGQSITGDSGNNQAGEHLSINSDGTIVAFALPGQKSGKVYQYNGTDTWNQIGQTITYTSSVDSISLSSDGNRVAISEMNDDTNGSNTGCTRVWEYNGTDTWNKIGQDIVGTNDNDYEGWYISLSGNGNRIGVKSRYANSLTGRDRIWEYNGSDTWNQIGQDIVGENTGDGGGGEIELNYDGSVFTTGFTHNDGNHSNAGFVRVYQYNGTDTWNKIGTDYDGLAEDDYSGRSVSISNDGHIIAIGADGNDDNGNKSGHVRIYETGLSGIVMGDAVVLAIPPTITSLTIASNNTQYPQKYATETDVVTLSIIADVSMNQPTVSFTSGGAAVAGAVTYTGSDTSWTAQYTVNSADTLGIVGFTVDMFSLLGSASGSQVTSTTDNTGITIILVESVFAYNVTATNANTQLGDTLIGVDDYGNEAISKRYATNQDGSIIVFGMRVSDANGNNSGRIEVKKYTTPGVAGGEWVDLGQDIAGAASSDLFGTAVAISDDGSIIAATGPRNDGNGNNSGEGRIYKYSNSDMTTGGTWSQIGQDILGLTGINFGTYVRLSSDGRRVVINSNPPSNSVASPALTYTRLYEYSNSDMTAGGTWEQIGDTHTIDTFMVFAGADAGLNTICYAYLYDDTYGNNKGLVQVWSYSSGTWTQKGQDMYDPQESGYSAFGECELNGDGNTLIIGNARSNGPDTGFATGRTEVYEYDNDNNIWVQKGNDIYGPYASFWMYGKVVISSDGNLLATGGRGASPENGTMMLYQYYSPTNEWVQIGNDYVGGITDDSSVDWAIHTQFSTDMTTVTITSENYPGGSEYLAQGYMRTFLTGYPASISHSSTSTFYIPPTITSLTISSNNTENTNYAIENNVITLTIVADVNMNQPTVSFTSGGDAVTGAVTYAGSDDSWTAQYTVNSADTLGIVGFTVDTQSVESLGNTSGSQATSATDGESVNVVFQLPPELTNLTISTSNSNSSLAITNDIITINLKTQQSIYSPALQLKSGGIDLSGNVEIIGSNNDWVATYIVEQEATNGQLTFVIDVSGTTMAQREITEANLTNASSISIITKPIPTISSVSVSNDNNIRVTFSEEVYSSNNGSGDLQVTDFELSILTGYATLSSSTPLAITKNSVTEYDLSFSATVGDSHSDIFIDAANDSSIFNLNGFPLDAGYASNNTGVLGQDTFALGLHEVSIISTNKKSGYAWHGFNDIVILSIKCKEIINQPVVVFQSGGQTVHGTVYYSPQAFTGEWFAYYTVNSQDTAGNVTFTINYTDLNGHAGNEVTSVTNNTNIQVVSGTHSETLETYTTWEQIGQTITLNDTDYWDSENITTNVSYYKFGTSIILSGDGKTLLMAIDSGDYEPLGSNNDDTGIIVCFKLNEQNQWQQKGNIIYGQKPGNVIAEYGKVVLNYDGTIILYTDTDEYDVVLLKYNFITQTWDTRLSFVYEDAPHGISMNKEGTTIAIGARLYKGCILFLTYRLFTDSDVGNYNYVSVVGSSELQNVRRAEDPLIITPNSAEPIVGNYYYTQTSILLEGAPETVNYNSSAINNVTELLKISEDGLSLVSADKYSQNASYEGAVYAYEYNGSAWVQKGFTVYGEAQNDNLGMAIDVNSDCTRFISGAEHLSNTNTLTDLTGTTDSISDLGYARVFEYRVFTSNDSGKYHYSTQEQNSNQPLPVIATEDSTTAPVVGNSYWMQLGFTIHNIPRSDESDDMSVAMSTDGNTIAIGNKKYKGHDESISNAGRLRVFEYKEFTNEDVDNFYYSGFNYGGTQTLPVIVTAFSGQVPVVGNFYWMQKLQDIVGLDSNVYVGGPEENSISMADGSLIVTKATNNKYGIEVRASSYTVINSLPNIPTFISYLDISSNNTDTSKANVGDIVTVDMHFDDNLTSAPEITLKSNNITFGGEPIITGSNNAWKSEYTVIYADITGAVTFSINAGLYINSEFTESDLTTSNSVTLENIPGCILNVTQTNNTNLHVTFSEEVFNTSGASGDLETSDFVLAVETGKGVLTSSTPSAISKVNNSEYDLSFSVTQTHIDATTLSVNPVDGASIYDASGDALVFPQLLRNTVDLTDSVNPSLSKISLSSNNSSNSRYALSGDIVSLDISASEAIFQPTVVFKSGNESVYNSVIYTGSDASWNASYTIHSSDTVGPVTFTINYTDLVSNTGIEGSVTTDNTSVTLVSDGLQIPPSLAALTHTYTQSTNNSSQGKNYVSAGDSYVIYAEFRETLATSPVIDISIGGNSIAQNGYIFATMTYYTNPVAEQYNGSNDKQYRWNLDLQQYMGDGDITYRIVDVSYSNMTVTHTNDEITDNSVFTPVKSGPIYENVVNVGLNGVRLTFNKDVFTESDGTGDLVINTFQFHQTGNTGSVYLNSLYPTSVTKVTDSIYDLSYDLVGAENNTSAFLLAVNKRTAALIYDASGLLFSTPYKGTTFLYDSTVVNLTSVSIVSDNSKTMFASYYTNDTVTLSFTSSESLYKTPVVSFTAGSANISGNVTVSGSGTTWTASYLVDQVDTLGLVEFTIDFTDGYNSRQVTSTTDNSKVTTVGTVVATIQQEISTTTGTVIGQEIPGSHANSSGINNATTALSADGMVVAFSEHRGHGDNNYDSGIIRAFLYDGTSTWNPLGSPFWEPVNNIQNTEWGSSLSISGDGSVVAFGAPESMQFYDDKGAVAIWKYSTPGSTGGTWSRLGEIIVGTTDNYFFGKVIKLSNDGYTLVVGMPRHNSPTGQDRWGAMQVWRYSDPGSLTGTWNQIGDTMYGDARNNYFANDVDISDDGNTIVGGTGWDDVGYVKAYQYNGSSWNQLGPTINFSGNFDRFGQSVAISGDGTVIYAAWCYNGSEGVYAYKYDSGSWISRGGKFMALYNSTFEENPGNIRTTYDGTIFSVADSGYTQQIIIYKYSVPGLTSHGSFSTSKTITDNTNNKMGNTHSLSSDGSRVSATLPTTDLNGNDSGSVKIYETGYPRFETITGTFAAIPPVISSLGILSNNTLSTSHATDTNTITVSMTYDENLTQSPTVTFQSGGLDVALSTTISGSDATYTASYVVDPNDTQGDVTFAIDASGTLADTNDTQLEITDGSSMEMLDSPPTFSSVTNEINKNISIEFSTDVYNTNTVSGDLETSDFVLAVESGDVTLTSTTPSAISKVSNKIYDLSFSLTETVTTNVPIVSINPVDSTSIYNSVGFAMIAPQTTDNSFNLIDRLPPSLTSVSISSNNTFKTKYASYLAPDTVTLTLTASENINQPVVTFTADDVPVTDTINYSGSGAAWTVSFVVTSSTPLGNLSFSIDYTDTTDGNAGTTITSTTDATNMLILEAVVTGTSTVQGDNFEQYGQTLFGPASSGDRYFASSDINNDGTIMVTSNTNTLDPVFGDNCYNVVVYEFDGASWTQKGSSLYQSSTSLASESSGNNNFGGSVSINSTGDIIAIGEDQYETATNVNNSLYSYGAVHIFQYDGNDWIQMGNSIVGSTNYLGFGRIVKLSSDGLTFFSVSGNYPNNSYTGKVEIYTYNSSNTTWELKGNAIEGEQAGERFGYASIDITSNGLTFAASSQIYKNAENVILGKAQVYTYNAVDNSFNQVGPTLYGTDGSNKILYVALSDDGTVLATARTLDDTPENNAGTVIVYKYDGANWNQIGQTIYGTNASDLLGWQGSIACNADGSQILIGAMTDENYTNTGSVSLYEYDGTNWNIVTILHGTRQNQYANYFANFNKNLEYLATFYNAYKPDGTNMDGILETFKRPATTVNQGYVLYPPDPTAVTVDSNGAHGTEVGVGETVSINIDFDDVVYDLSNISILIDDVSINNPFTITPDPPATSFTISFVISESDPSGNITFSMDASGALGVTTITHSLITDGSSMETDFTIPLFTGSLSTSTQLNTFDPTYLQGFLDISGAGIRMQNDSKLFIGGDVSLAGNMFIDSTNSVKINTTENNAGYSLNVSGNTDLSGNVSIAGDIDVSGNVSGLLNFNTINKNVSPISNSVVDYSDNTDETALPVGIKVMTNDNLFNNTTATIHNDLSANGNFGSTFIFDNSLSVAGSVLVSDLSQNSYGAYTIYSKKDSTDSFMVGKSASNVFTIVNQSNVGVYMASDSNVLTSASDKNLKTNIYNLENNSDNIMKLRPVEFNWKYEEDDKEKHVGFIAQEVEEIFPELVEENIYPNGEVYKGVNTNKLIPYMIDEIKLLEEKLKKLEKNK